MFAIVTGRGNPLSFFLSFSSFYYTDGKKPPDERRYVVLICHGSSGLRNRRRWPGKNFRGCSGFHNANYDRFTLPLRKRSRHRAGYHAAKQYRKLTDLSRARWRIKSCFKSRGPAKGVRRKRKEKEKTLDDSFQTHGIAPQQYPFHCIFHTTTLRSGARSICRGKCRNTFLILSDKRKKNILPIRGYKIIIINGNSEAPALYRV
ncbi:hypothetical protein PUN28_002804 [Cardiocondyla obscurior]|uniref:Ribosomal protein L2 n=1 Tax=Cardiocondyla obscurior TaxID=286306 RepID=A0AAW2GW68_9HYME